MLPPGTLCVCSETATASGGQGNNEINMTCTKPKCSIRDMIKQVEELIGIDETESQGNITIQQLVGFADDILGRREACKDSIRPACTSSSAISISSYCSQGSYEFEGPDPLESLGFDQSTLDKIQKLEVEHLKQTCSNTDELTQQLEAALEKYKAWLGLEKITYGDTKNIWVPNKNTRKIEQYSLKPNRREDINREPLMNAFSWTETEVNDWVCARPMNGTIEVPFEFPTLKGHLTRKKWDSLSPVEAYEVQNERNVLFAKTL